MFRTTALAWGARLRSGAAAVAKRRSGRTFLAVPATASLDARRETAAQREFERLIDSARRQKKRQIKTAIKAALKKQAQIGDELTARQHRYAANKVMAEKELQRIATAKERRQLQEKVTKDAAEASAASAVSVKRHRNRKPKAGLPFTPEELARKRHQEEKQTAQFFATLTKLQRQRKKEVTELLRASIQEAKRAMKDAAAVTEPEDVAVQQEVADSVATPTTKTDEERSSSAKEEKKKKRSASSQRQASTPVPPAVVAVDETKDTTVAQGSRNIVDMPATKVKVGDDDPIVTPPPKERRKKAPLASVEAKTHKVKEISLAAASPSAELLPETADDGRAAYFDAVRKHVGEQVATPSVSEAAKATHAEPVAVPSNTSNWPAPESTTGLFRL